MKVFMFIDYDLGCKNHFRGANQIKEMFMLIKVRCFKYSIQNVTVL